MTAMRSLIVSASSWSCVTYTNVVRVRAWISLSSSCISWRSLRSSAPSGSSSSSAAGSLTSARARATRCCWPPESCAGPALLHPLEAHRAQRLRDARRAHRRAPHALDAQPERDVLEHAHVREQRVGLEHHVDVPLGRRHARDVAAAQQDAALVGSSKPAIMRSVVVLPQPDGPSIEKNSPSWISNETSSTATTSSKRFVTDSRTIASVARCAGVARVQAATIEAHHACASGRPGPRRARARPRAGTRSRRSRAGPPCR